jgi:hypothetical protein
MAHRQRQKLKGGIPKRSITHEAKYKKYKDDHRLEKNKERKRIKREKHLLKLKQRKENKL